MIDEAAIRRQIAAGLRRARRAAGLTLEQAAERLHRSTSGLRHLESGRHSIRVEQLPELARAFGLTVRELIAEMRLVHQARERRNPGPRPDTSGAAGASVEGSANGGRSTLADPRGDASHPQHTVVSGQPPAPNSTLRAHH